MKYLNIILRTALGGMSNNVSKLAITSIPLYYFLIFRYIGMLVLNGVLSKKSLHLDLLKMVVNSKLRMTLYLSAILSGLGTIFFYIGLQELPVTVVSLLDNSFHIIFVFLIALIFMGKREGVKFYIYFLMLFPSLYLILFKDLTFDTSLSVVGIIMLMLNGLVSAIEVHLTKNQLKEISVTTNVLVKTFISLIISIICIIVFNNKWSDVLNGFTYIVGLLLIYNILNSYIIKVLHTKSIKDLGAFQTTLFTALTPVFGIIFAMLIFKESLTITQWVGVVMIVVILYKLNTRNRKIKPI